MKNLKITFIIISLLNLNLSVNAAASTTISASERKQCDAKPTESEKSSCHAELTKLEADYKKSQTELTNEKDMEKRSNLLSAAGAAYGAYQIIGSVALGAIKTGSCYSCLFGDSVSIMAFLYKSSLSDKYEKQYNQSKKNLDNVYKNGKSSNNGDFQYIALEAEIAAIKDIHEAAKSKSKSHGNLQKMYGLVAAAATVEIIVCSMPYSGCSGNVAPAAKTLGISAIALALESKAKGETDERVAKAKTALDATTKLKEKFHKFYEVTADTSAGSSTVVSATGAAINSSGTNTRSFNVKNTDSSGETIDKSNVTTNIEVGSSGQNEIDPNATCLAKSGDLLSCGDVDSKGTYEIATILPSSKYTNELEDKTNLSGAANILNKAFKGDFSELEKIGDNAKMATGEDFFKENIRKLLDKPKNLDPEVIKQLEESLKNYTDEELALAVLENADPATLAALTHKNLFGSTSEIKLEDVVHETPNELAADIQMTDGSLGDKANVAKSAFKEELLDLDGIDSTQTNLDGFEAQTPAGKYQAAINEYMKKRKPGEEIIYNDIHTSKEDSIFDIISNRYKSNHVIHRLSSKKKKDIQ